MTGEAGNTISVEVIVDESSNSARIPGAPERLALDTMKSGTHGGVR
jgi:hypothetical protein